ncbi:MAG TPA: large conductance mechanosensitive channel protein MscL [Saprospiraceae bacterium]|nr:large conductance mechanosensitive channel protein MscL [Saprospiraceae bacterium]
MWKEFKAFLLRGDVLALAVAVIIGGAFQKIVDSMVTDVITPIIGMIGGNPDFSSIVIGGKPDPADPSKIAGGIMLGKFINSVISFATIGFILFLMVKSAGKKSEDIK